MAIKASILTQSKRATTCKIVVPNDEGGGVHEEEIRIIYFSPSIEWWRNNQQTQTAEPVQRKDLAIALGEIIAELPDIVDDDGVPVEPTVEFLAQMMIENLDRINKAIGEDLDPEKVPVAVLARYILTEGAQGKALNDMLIYWLAMEMHMTPAEIRGMDLYDFNRLAMLREADALAAKERLNRKR